MIYPNNNSAIRVSFFLSATFLVIINLYIPVSHDTAWLLHQSVEFLDSSVDKKVLFTHFLVSDLLIHLPGALLAKWFGWHPLFAIKIFHLGIFICCLGIFYRQISFITKSTFLTFCIMLAFLPLAFTPWIQFGQRDHLLLFFIISYILTVITRRFELKPNLWISIFAGISAFMAIAIKLHYVLILILLELYLLCWHRSFLKIFRVESVLLAVFSLGYFFFIVFFVPQVVSSTLTMLFNFYWTYSTPWAERFLLFHGVVLFGVGLSFYLSKATEKIKAAQLILIVSIIGAYLAFLLLGNTWPYRQYPFMGLAYLYFISCAIYYFIYCKQSGVAESSGAGKLWVMNLLLLSLVIKVCVFDHAFFRDFQGWLRGEKVQWMVNLVGFADESAILAELPKVHSMFVMDTDLFPHALVMMQHNYQWVGRYHSMWQFPAWARFRANEKNLPKLSTQEMSAAISQVYKNIGDDLAKNEPDVIIVNISKNKAYFNNIPFDFVRDFNAHIPTFKNIWPDYTFFRSYSLNGTQVEMAVYVKSDLLP